MLSQRPIVAIYRQQRKSTLPANIYPKRCGVSRIISLWHLISKKVHSKIFSKSSIFERNLYQRYFFERNLSKVYRQHRKSTLPASPQLLSTPKDVEFQEISPKEISPKEISERNLSKWNVSERNLSKRNLWRWNLSKWNLSQ